MARKKQHKKRSSSFSGYWDPRPRSKKETLADEGPESIRDFFSELFGVQKKFEQFRRFVRTRRLIKDGKNLYDQSKSKLKEMDAMGPLTFNLYQTTIAAIPTQLMLWWAQAAGLLNVEIPKLSEGKYSKATLLEFTSWYPTIAAFFSPFTIPVLFLALAWAASWCCVNNSDASREQRERSRNAYLYFDATYGLIPQMILAFCFTCALLRLTGSIQSQEEISVLEAAVSEKSKDLVALFAGLLLLPAMAWNALVTWEKVPKLLFVLNGYSPKDPIFGADKIPNRAPWRKYQFGMLAAGAVLLPLLLSGLNYLATGATIIVALAAATLKGL